MTICPHCGKPTITDARGSWDPETMRYRWDGGEVIFTEFPGKMFGLMWKRFGRNVSNDSFMDYLYSGAADPPYEQVNKQRICLMRKQLRGSPLTIYTAYGMGWRLEFRGGCSWHAASANAR